MLDCLNANLSSEWKVRLDVLEQNESDGNWKFDLFFVLGIEGGPLEVFCKELIFDCDPGKVDGEGSLPVKTNVFPDVLGRFEDKLEPGINVFGIQFGGIGV